MDPRRGMMARAAAIAVAAIAGCSSKSSGPVYPETITFDGQTPTKAAAWTRGGMSGIVYVRPGQALPGADLQVGVIVSSDHPTGTALHEWIAAETRRSGHFQAHESAAHEESCRVAADARGPGREYMTLQVCRAGVARAACVEADETLESGVFTSCLNSPGCFEGVCDQRWLARREALDNLLADFLTIR